MLNPRASAADEKVVTGRHKFLMGIHAVALTVTAAVTVLASRAHDWDKPALLVALLVFTILSSCLTIRWRGVTITGAFAALILAATLLGPGPAVLIGIGGRAVAHLQRRVEPRYVLSSLCTWTTFPLVGAMLMRLLAPSPHESALFCATVFGVYLLCNFLNFALIWGYLVAADGKRWRTGFTEVFAHVLPVDLATGLGVVGVVFAELHVGSVSIVLTTLVVLLFQYMARTALEAYERGEELELRNGQLASMHIGLISTMLKTLSLRDHMTARHSAAVARYSRAMAEALELDSEAVELIHTAALFHDIGKFIFPDSILLADRRLSDEEFVIVKRHPVVGADLISEIDGYGPIAEIVRHHHERIDGRGYPDGIAGDAIPLGSRMIAVADVYDVITARDTYRTPVSVQEAFAELRRSAGTQLDAELVELFIGLVERHGVMFRHSTAADFEAELALERRVTDYAAPRPIAA
jgi:putative nucleotidyltransferase with HDIG domain